MYCNELTIKVLSSYLKNIYGSNHSLMIVGTCSDCKHEEVTYPNASFKCVIKKLLKEHCVDYPACSKFEPKEERN